LLPEGQALVLGLLEDWETTNVDFKRELRLDTKDEKAEFVRDVLALANTQVTGDRYLVTGFDPKTQNFTTTVDPKVTSDTIENILNELHPAAGHRDYKTLCLDRWIRRSWTSQDRPGPNQGALPRQPPPSRRQEGHRGEPGLRPAQQPRVDRLRWGDRWT